jgi:hypothetical protein
MSRETRIAGSRPQHGHSTPRPQEGTRANGLSGGLLRLGGLKCPPNDNDAMTECRVHLRTRQMNNRRVSKGRWRDNPGFYKL